MSHFFTCLHVLISSSSLLIDFFSRCSSLFHLRIAPSLLDSVSSESQSYHRTTSLVCFGCVTLCHQICSILLCVNLCKICQFLLHYVLHIHVLQHHMFHSSKSSLGCPCFCRLIVNMVHENCKRCFVTILSATPVVRATNSASAELKLTVCCVRDHAVSVAFRHCTTPPLVLLHVVACLAQSLSVYTFTNFEGVVISIRLFAPGAPFKNLTLRFRLISSLSVGHVIFLAVSFTRCT